MAQSETIGALAKALSLAQGKMGHALKDQENAAFKRGQQVSKYADLASIIDVVRGPLAEHGLSYVQPLYPHETLVHVGTVLMHESGEWITSAVYLSPSAKTPHAIGSCITYGRRFLLAAIAGVAQADDDGNGASGVNGPSPDEIALVNVIESAERADSLESLKEVYDKGLARFTGNMDAIQRITAATTARKKQLQKVAA